MKQQTKLTPGLYKIKWKGRGSSLAAVGYTRSGVNWYAPCNWVASFRYYPAIACTEWSIVKKVKLIKVNEIKKNETN